MTVTESIDVKISEKDMELFERYLNSMYEKTYGTRTPSPAEKLQVIYRILDADIPDVVMEDGTIISSTDIPSEEDGEDEEVKNDIVQKILGNKQNLIALLLIIAIIIASYILLKPAKRPPSGSEIVDSMSVEINRDAVFNEKIKVVINYPSLIKISGRVFSVIPHSINAAKNTWNIPDEIGENSILWVKNTYLNRIFITTTGVYDILHESAYINFDEPIILSYYGQKQEYYKIVEISEVSLDETRYLMPKEQSITIFVIDQNIKQRKTVYVIRAVYDILLNNVVNEEMYYKPLMNEKNSLSVGDTIFIKNYLQEVSGIEVYYVASDSTNSIAVFRMYGDTSELLPYLVSFYCTDDLIDKPISAEYYRNDNDKDTFVKVSCPGNKIKLQFMEALYEISIHQ